MTTIRDLALVGNRRTVAAIDRRGSVVWYCPGRFDRPTLFASLLDPDGGAWRLDVDGEINGIKRQYRDESTVLNTELETAAGVVALCDWMPAGPSVAALCREITAAGASVNISIGPRPDYGQRAPSLERGDDGAVVVDKRWYLYASVPAELHDGEVRYQVSPGQKAWFVLADEPLPKLSAPVLEHWRVRTLRYWDDLHWQTRYSGPYEREVKDSLRALRLLTFEDNGAVIAAATFGLPEVAGGARNYDYRYVWLRDAAMIVSALVRAGSEGTEERRFLQFLCNSRHKHELPHIFPPFMSLDGADPPELSTLPWRGYQDSRPVQWGNGAGHQLQLDGLSNVLLAAKLIYKRFETREHWDVVEEIAEYLSTHWHKPDHGIWEESPEQQYTASKVVTAVALRFIAEHSEDSAQAERWRRAVADIHDYVVRHCITSDGAYAAVAGGDAVDVSAALFPVWDYCAADSPEMRATMVRLERDYSRDGLLYWRHLECFDSREEGAFIAGTLWVAQYWIMRDELERAERILHAALVYSNDVGLFSEEGAPGSDEMLGNLPQAFAHAALVGMVVDLKAAYEKRREEK